MKRNYTVRIILFSVATAVLLTACGMGGNAQVDLEGITWELEVMGPRSNPSPALPERRPTLKFIFEDGWVNGRAGCNSYSAKFKINGDRLSIDDPASTLMGCFPQEIMNQETEFLRMLAGAKSYSIEDGQLTIISSGNKVLVFTQD